MSRKLNARLADKALRDELAASTRRHKAQLRKHAERAYAALVDLCEWDASVMDSEDPAWIEARAVIADIQGYEHVEGCACAACEAADPFCEVCETHRRSDHLLVEPYGCAACEADEPVTHPPHPFKAVEP